MGERKPVTDWATDFDYLDPAWVDNPFPIWDEMRQKCPVAHTDRFEGVYFISRYEDVLAAAKDTEHFSSRRILAREGRPPAVPARPLTSDPPEHRAIKQMLVPAFTPEVVARYKIYAQEICRELLQNLAGKKECDAANEYSQEVPLRVTASMLGVSRSDWNQLRTWAHEFFETGITDAAILRRVFIAMDGFFTKEIAKRRRTPGDDLVSFLLEARIEGELLSEPEIKETLLLILTAGIDTTWSAIGASIWHLATHDEDRQRLVDEPGLIPTAVEEFLRAYSPVTTGRDIAKDTELNGCPIKVGNMALLSFPSANRDPSVFPDADQVVLDRKPNRHIAFGFGIHNCLGANLARMEIIVALQEWLAKIPYFRLAPGAEVKWSLGQVRGPRHLPLIFDPAV